VHVDEAFCKHYWLALDLNTPVKMAGRLFYVILLIAHLEGSCAFNLFGLFGDDVSGAGNENKNVNMYPSGCVAKLSLNTQAVKDCNAKWTQNATYVKYSYPGGFGCQFEDADEDYRTSFRARLGSTAFVNIFAGSQYKPPAFCRNIPTQFGDKHFGWVNVPSEVVFGNSLTHCCKCPPGTMSVLKDSTSNHCELCPVGKYQSQSGKSSCNNCSVSEGNYCPGKGSSAETPCKAGNAIMTDTINNRWQRCMSITSGWYMPKGTWDANKARRCPDGTITLKTNQHGETACRPCGRGSYNPSVRNETELEIQIQDNPQIGNLYVHVKKEAAFGTNGYVQKVVSQMKLNRCICCPSGRYQSQIGKTFCHACKQGFATHVDYRCRLGVNRGVASLRESLNNTIDENTGIHGAESLKMCVPGCPPGQHCKNVTNGQCAIDSTGSVLCEACPAGRNSKLTNIQDNCDACEAGTYQRSKGQMSCEKCAHGKSSSTGAEECKRCEPGQYQQPGHRCQDCNTGRYSKLGFATACTVCQNGTFQNQTRQSTCLHCEQGMHVPEKWHGRPEKCEACTEGRYQPYTPLQLQQRGTAADRCFACEAGRYNSERGADSCKLVPKGRYVNDRVDFADKIKDVQSLLPNTTVNAEVITFRTGARLSDITECPAGTYSDRCMQHGYRTGADGCGNIISNNACMKCKANRASLTTGRTTQCDSCNSQSNQVYLNIFQNRYADKCNHRCLRCFDFWGMIWSLIQLIASPVYCSTANAVIEGFSESPAQCIENARREFVAHFDALFDDRWCYCWLASTNSCDTAIEEHIVLICIVAGVLLFCCCSTCVLKIIELFCKVIIFLAKLVVTITADALVLCVREQAKIAWKLLLPFITNAVLCLSLFLPFVFYAILCCITGRQEENLFKHVVIDSAPSFKVITYVIQIAAAVFMILLIMNDVTYEDSIRSPIVNCTP